MPALVDAGAGPSDAAVRAWGDLAAQEHPRLDVTLRACRYPPRVRLWKALPAEQFAVLPEPGAYVSAPPKEVRLAETTTVLKGATAEPAVRTVLCREVVRGPKRDRWQPLFTTSLLEAEEVRGLFRLRQRHAQGYRVGVPDEFLDAVPCGDDQESPDPKGPRWQRGPLQMLGWRVALVDNAAADWARTLAGDGEGCHVRTVRRTFWDRPGTLSQTPAALLVPLERFGGQEALAPAVAACNADGHRLPWLENRRVVVSLTPAARPRAGP